MDTDCGRAPSLARFSFLPERALLAKDASGRYQVALNVYREQVAGGGTKVTGGSLAFSITTGVESSPEAFQQLQANWHAATGQASARFVPLNVRKGKAQVLLDPKLGSADQAHNDMDIGTPGGAISFLVELTELGALQCQESIQQNRQFPIPLNIDMEYLTLVPPTGAEIKIHGRRVFTHLSAALEVSYDGWFYGGSAKVEAAWEDMYRNGDIEIRIVGDPPPELATMRDKLMQTFLDEGLKRFWDALFVPKPEIPPAQAGSSGGWFGGANFALKWRSETDVTDLSMTIVFEGWTWLTTRMSADLSPMFRDLDETIYLTAANPQQAVVAALVVDADPMIETVAIAWSASEGIAPQSPVFGKDGGILNYTLYTQHPDSITYAVNAAVNFVPSDWPIISYHQTTKPGTGRTPVSIKLADLIERKDISLYVLGGNQGRNDPQDHIVLNLTCTGHQFRHPLTDSGKLVPGGNVLEMSYPRHPDGLPTTIKASCFGVVQGKYVELDKEVDLPEAKDAYRVLVDTKTGTVEIR